MSEAHRVRRFVVLMVGLPARGKTYTARKLAGYLSWLGHRCRVFNVGERRRSLHGARTGPEFFDDRNEEARAHRRALGLEVLDELLGWLRTDGHVGIYDATNSTFEHRELVRARCRAAGVEVLHVEITANDPEIVDENIREVKLGSPDFAGLDARTARDEFMRRLAHYERVYEALRPDEGSWIRIVDRGSQLVLNHIDGYLPGRMVFFLSNLHVSKRALWLTRHGESEFNLQRRVGGDPPLSTKGRSYARQLSRAVHEGFGEDAQLEVWTSTLQRSRATAEATGMAPVVWRTLDEINAGVCEGMSYEEIRTTMPEVWEARQRDKFGYRYPLGESYEDVIQRLDRVIIELERYRTPVLVVSHRAVLRALYAYMVQLPREGVPFIDMPLHAVVELVPTAYGCLERTRRLGPDVGLEA